MPTKPHTNRQRPRPPVAPMAYRLADCPELCGISVSGLRRLIATGRLRAVRHGRIVLVPAEELRRLAGSEAA